MIKIKTSFKLCLSLSVIMIFIAGCYNDDNIELSEGDGGIIINSVEISDKVEVDTEMEIKINLENAGEKEYSWATKRGKIKGERNKAVYKAPSKEGLDEITLKISNHKGEEQLLKKEIEITKNNLVDSYLTLEYPDAVQKGEETLFVGKTSPDIVTVKLSASGSVLEEITVDDNKFSLNYEFDEQASEKELKIAGFNSSGKEVAKKEGYITIEKKSVYDQDLELLARAVMGEAEGEPYKGQVAVAAVVLNRVESNAFPDTIYDVLYQKNQFTIVKSGRIYLSPNKSSIKAAKAALNGEDPSKEALFFYNPEIARNMSFFNSLEKIIKIENHIFAKAK